MQRLPWLFRVMRQRTAGRPAARHDVRYEPALRVPAADGSNLLTDHYSPMADLPCPTVLVRCPYGRGFPWGYLYGVLLAEQGFHVVLQSSRGTGGSGGSFDLWRNEAADSQATVAWLRRQAWFTGAFATVGASYLGYVQWALALDPPPEWRAAVIQVGLHDPYSFYYASGAFTLEQAIGGMALLGGGATGPLQQIRATLRLLRHHAHVERTLPLIDSYPRAFGERRPPFEDLLTHPDGDDPYWAAGDVGPAAEHLDVPVGLVSGWHDILLDQTLQQYARLRRAGHRPSLLIGPWTHTSALGQGWPDVFADTLALLRAHLQHDPSGLRPTTVRVHVGGAEQWRDLSDWPPPATSRRYHLRAGGALTVAAPPASAGTTFRYDPADPTPSIGGQVLSARAGRRDNRVLEARADVLVFTTEPLTEAMEVLGPVSAELHVTTTTGHADLFARLCDVDPAGRSHNVCDGLRRLDRAGPVTVAMSSTAHRFAAGHRIRLQVSGGAHPRFARNTGTGEPVATGTQLRHCDITVHHEPGRASALTLPVV